ncbi:hypothetical protein GPL15_02820 [Clostridium sp. MCC353]|uniref:hypothetical protein n=1 Tax=Clostridium sp. MCC353 TaxID=2592646 RepID=UPI001C017BDE|nr:hypothetical protein [Clostridium sp. MCC353]MBT9775440.1 hypothetical protein [Clostridium sp. MCC353]
MKIKKAVLVLLTGSLLMNTIPCFAAAEGGGTVKVSSTSSVSSEDYSQIPDAETLQKDVGFVPKTADALAGGFKFISGSITESFDMDTNGNITNKTKGISFKYDRDKDGNVKSVTYSAEPHKFQVFPENSHVTKYGEVELYFDSQYANYLAWAEDDIFYHLIDINKKVTEEEMIDMAKGIIDIKKAADKQ